MRETAPAPDALDPLSRSSVAGELKTASLNRPRVVRRLFGSTSYFRLWLAQVVSSLGDWIGLVAVLALAVRVGGSSAASVGLVMSARMVPGLPRPGRRRARRSRGPQAGDGDV